MGWQSTSQFQTLGDQVEVEHEHSLFEHPGKVRVLGGATVPKQPLLPMRLRG